MRSFLLIMILSFYFTAFSQLPVNNETDYMAEDSVVVNMPDGGSVCLLIIRKKDNTRQPCILWYNIYADSSSLTREYGKMEAAKDDYAFVMANTRGKKCSSDDIYPFERDADDAYYIIDWISKQPWSNGKVGMLGGSYLGFSQWSATKHLHPSLKTIVPQVAVGPGIDYPMENGVFMSYMLRWIHFVSNNKLTDDQAFSDTATWNKIFSKWYYGGYPFIALDSLEGKRSKIFGRWLSHPTYDDYWKKMIPQKGEFSHINIPVLTVTGYWDDDQLGALYYYKQWTKYNPRGEHYLVLGPYDHKSAQGYVRDTILGLPTDSEAKKYSGDIVMKWFDHILKDSSMPELIKDKVNFEMTGENKWYNVSSFDKMSNSTLVFYLDKGSLIRNKPSGINEQILEVDFKKREFIKPFGEDLAAFPSIVMDSIIKNPDQLYFCSAPVENDLFLSGNYTADLKFIINKKDIDFVADLYEQTPQGKYIGLSETVQRASLARDRSARQLLEPGKVQQIKMENTFLMCKKISKGSRLVFAIGVNKSPYWQINYGTGKDVSIENINDAKEPLLIKWLNGSRISLKILK